MFHNIKHRSQNSLAMREMMLILNILKTNLARRETTDPSPAISLR